VLSRMHESEAARDAAVRIGFVELFRFCYIQNISHVSGYLDGLVTVPSKFISTDYFAASKTYNSRVGG
jgi:hypothetical protein